MNQPASLIVRPDLKGLPVMLSASVPDELAGKPRAQDLVTAAMLLTHQILSANGRVVFGGHPSITPRSARP